MNRLPPFLSAPAAVIAAVLAMSSASAQIPAPLRTQDFTLNPNWTNNGNNHIVLPNPSVTQDFGYSSTNFAGQSAGEIGGRIQRASIPAYYAKAIAVRTLDDPFANSGSFAITATSSGAGVFLGYFDSQQPGGTGRPLGSLCMDFDCENAGARLAVRVISDDNQSAGRFITRYENYSTPEEKPIKRPTPIKKDGTRYYWAMEYDPNIGYGRILFIISSSNTQPVIAGSPLADPAFPDIFEDRVFAIDITSAVRLAGATFDRFGVTNGTKPGGAATFYFDDLQFAGQVGTERFSVDPLWAASGNRATYLDMEPVGGQDFGFRTTNIAAGAPGEIGGIFWRTEANWGYYADSTASLTPGQRLHAHGKVRMVGAGPDSGMCIGWFDSTQTMSPMNGRNFLGINVGGPTRVGHYFNPTFITATGARRQGPLAAAPAPQPPVLKPGINYDWSLTYDPAGNGTMSIYLHDRSPTNPLPDATYTLPLLAGQKNGVVFDRFGLFSTYPGGQNVKIYFDDLAYTVLPPDPDGDGDGIADPWEQAYGLSPANTGDASADADGDGATNAQEFIAGTNPRDPSSRLRIRTCGLAGLDFWVTFPSVLGKEYAFETSDLFGVWTVLQSNLPGTGSDMTLAALDAAAFPRRFYRFRALP